jgi:hypothetical protein
MRSLEILMLCIALATAQSSAREEMTDKNSAEVPNMRQRTILQHLSLADWRMVDRLPISAGEITLSRLLHHGWIECRGEQHHMAIRLTPAGLKAMRSPT